MTNQQILEGNWNEIKGKLRQKWGQLTDQDLPQICGDVDQIIGIIQRKTGETREVIERYLQEVSGSAASAIGMAAETVWRLCTARFRDRAAHGQASCRPGGALATTKRNDLSAIGWESRCLCVSEWV